MEKRPDIKERVLPSGRFAKTRPMTGRDYLALSARGSSDPDANVVFLMLILSTTIDDQPITYEQLLDMDMRDINALACQVIEYVSGPIR